SPPSEKGSKDRSPVTKKKPSSLRWARSPQLNLREKKRRQKKLLKKTRGRFSLQASKSLQRNKAVHLRAGPSGAPAVRKKIHFIQVDPEATDMMLITSSRKWTFVAALLTMGLVASCSSLKSSARVGSSAEQTHGGIKYSLHQDTRFVRVDKGKNG